MRHPLVCAISTMSMLASAAPALGATVNAVPLRFYLAKNDDRSLVSAYDSERDAIHQRGDFYDGEQLGWVFVQPVIGTVPLYRFMKPTSGDHFFTADAAEGQQAITKYGYVAEGICCYVAAPVHPATTASVALNRFQRGAFHRYRTGMSIGWKSEGVAGFIWHDPVSLPSK